MGKIHNKLFYKLTSLYKEEDDYINKCIHLLEERKVTKSELGIRNDIQCDLSESIGEMKKLDRKDTPLSKLISIHAVSSLISSAVSAFVALSRKSSDSSSSGGLVHSQIFLLTIFLDAAVTTDDLIPLMTEVILQSKPRYLHSSLFYMENFIFSNIANTSLGYFCLLLR